MSIFIIKKNGFIGVSSSRAAKYLEDKMVLTNCNRFSFEKLDCTVRAIAHACNVPYSESHKFMKANGRKDRHRVSFNEVMEGKTELFGKQVLKVNHVGTVKSFLEKNPIGKFMVNVRGHIFAVVDGKVYDLAVVKIQAPVRQIWQIN